MQTQQSNSAGARTQPHEFNIGVNVYFDGTLDINDEPKGYWIVATIGMSDGTPSSQTSRYMREDHETEFMSHYPTWVKAYSAAAAMMAWLARDMEGTLAKLPGGSI